MHKLSASLIAMGFIYHIEASIFFVCVLLVLGIVIRMASYVVPYQIVCTHFEVSHIVLFVFKMCVHTSVRIVTKNKMLPFV